MKFLKRQISVAQLNDQHTPQLFRHAKTDASVKLSAWHRVLILRFPRIMPKG